MLLDAMMGLMILAAVVIMLAAGVRQYGSASRQLADHRQAVHIAEGVLTRIQMGETAGEQDMEPGGAVVQVEMIEGTDAIAGRRWVQVVVVVGDREARLLGLAPVKMPVEMEVEP